MQGRLNTSVWTFKIFFLLLNFPKTHALSCLATCLATLIQSLLYQRSSPALLSGKHISTETQQLPEYYDQDYLKRFHLQFKSLLMIHISEHSPIWAQNTKFCPKIQPTLVKRFLISCYLTETCKIMVAEKCQI